jgi:PadR family transcriptional regulator AphA
MSLRIALLGLLDAKGPASGYDLAKLFEHSINHVWQAGHTQIYPELVKMAADGLVTVESEGARNRKMYAITPEGAGQVRSWLVEHDPSEVLRNEVALQAFLLPLLDREAAITVVERIRARYAKRLAELECIPTSDTPSIGRYALKLGIAHCGASLDWADATLAELRQQTPVVTPGAPVPPQ